MRGLEGRGIIVDEAGFIEQVVYDEGLLPMLKKRPSFLIMISTQSKFSFLNLVKELDIRTGSFLQFSSRCKKCAKKKVDRCTHMGSYQSSTTTEKRNKQLEEVYRVIGNTEAYKTEIHSTGLDNKSNRFNPEDVESFIYSRGNYDPDKPRFGVIGCDPAGDGKSDFFLTCIVMDRRDEKYYVSGQFFFIFYFSLHLRR